MAFNSVINSASRYFDTIGNIILDTHGDNHNPVYPGVLDSVLRTHNLTVTKTALEAHIWAKEQLGYALTRWYKDGITNEWHHHNILNFYRNVNEKEYKDYSNWRILDGALIRWKERQAFYTLKGDIDSATFCAWKAELTAMAMASNSSVEQLQSNANLLDSIEARLGTFDPSALDRVGLQAWLPK